MKDEAAVFFYGTLTRAIGRGVAGADTRAVVVDDGLERVVGVVGRHVGK